MKRSAILIDRLGPELSSVLYNFVSDAFSFQNGTEWKSAGNEFALCK